MEILEVHVSSITDFGNSTAEQQLDMLENHLNNQKILLFQYYSHNYCYDENNKNDFFENYCDDLVHYYNPQLHLEIDQAVLSELMKDVSLLAEMEQNMVLAKELFRREAVALCCSCFFLGNISIATGSSSGS